jgi:hypothetical protein
MNKIVQTAEFSKVKGEYEILFAAVEKVQKNFDIHLMVDFTGKSIIIYNLRKMKKGFEKINSASFYQKNISDDFYEKNNNGKEKIKNSLTELIISRLELANGNRKKD